MKSPFLFSLLIPIMFLFISADHHKAKTNSYPGHGSVISGGALEFTDANFQKKVLSADKLTLVDFWAEWCGPCRRMGPVIEELAKEYGSKVNVGKLNVDHNPNVCARYNITSIPTILFIKNGKVVDKVIGLNPKSKLEKKIKALM